MGVSDEEVAPTFTKKPTLRQEDDGNKLVFECQLVTNPKAAIQWYRGDVLLHEDHRTKVTVKEIGPNKFNITLELDDVFETDAGMYKVTAKNKLGEVSASINLNFSPADEPHDYQTDGIPPTFAKKPTIRQEDEGRRLLFECRILSDPKPTVTWFHDNTPVKESARFKLKLDKDGNAYFSTLEINDVTIEDAGKYKVTAKNELGESHASISLNFDSEDDGVPAEGTRPVFTEKPIIKGADNFSRVTFECRLIADPKPAIQWYHNGKPITDGGRYKYGLISDKHNHVVSLEVQKITASDGGEYKAVATNKHGDGSANITLNFEDDKPQIPQGKTPRFPKKPTIRQEGENLILECILEADPMPEIVWYHGTKKIKDGKRHKIQQKSKGADTYLLSLEIQDPVSEDGGNYRCNAINELGESNANIALNFQGGDAKSEGLAPEFLEKPRIIPKEGGKLIIMQCKVKAKPAPKITWYQGTKAVKETNRVQAKVIEGAGDEFTVSLEVRDPSKDDGGAYKCHMVNDHGELNANLNLDIQAEKAPAGEAPTFVEKPKITPEDGGNRIIMECKVKASPKPDIKWTCDGSEVRESTRIKQTIKQEKDVYHIKLELRVKKAALKYYRQGLTKGAKS